MLIKPHTNDDKTSAINIIEVVNYPIWKESERNNNTLIKSCGILIIQSRLIMEYGDSHSSCDCEYTIHTMDGICEYDQSLKIAHLCFQRLQSRHPWPVNWCRGRWWRFVGVIRQFRCVDYSLRRIMRKEISWVRQMQQHVFDRSTAAVVQCAKINDESNSSRSWRSQQTRLSVQRNSRVNNSRWYAVWDDTRCAWERKERHHYLARTELIQMKLVWSSIRRIFLLSVHEPSK